MASAERARCKDGPGPMGARSAGLLLYRISPEGAVEVLIAHPGGPFWARKDDAAWSVPKGEYLPDEDALVAAYREFEEEVGLAPPGGRVVFLGERRQPGGKRVSVWGLEGDLDMADAVSNTFELEWPRGSGQLREFPEVDRVEWVSVDQARRKLVKGQTPFLDVLLEAVAPGHDRVEPGPTSPGPG
jgi:predicted NUDIX family NTP pyrophosphohydrolase